MLNVPVAVLGLYLAGRSVRMICGGGGALVEGGWMIQTRRFE